MTTAPAAPGGPAGHAGGEPSGRGAEDALLPGAAGDSLGAWLSAARLGRGLTLAEVAALTKVRPGILEAIEADQHDRLPAPTYTLGFIKAFARTVGLDPAEAAERYRAIRVDQPTPAMADVVQLDETRLPRPALVAASTLALVVVLAGVWLLGREREGERLPPTPPLAALGPAGAAGPGPVAAQPPGGPAPPLRPDSTPAGDALARSGPGAMQPAAAALPSPSAAPGAAFALRAVDEVWLRVRSAEGLTLFEGTLAPGQMLDLPAGSSWRLRTGRAGALVPVVNGRVLAPLGGPAEQLRDVPLDARVLAGRPSS